MAESGTLHGAFIDELRDAYDAARRSIFSTSQHLMRPRELRVRRKGGSDGCRNVFQIVRLPDNLDGAGLALGDVVQVLEMGAWRVRRAVRGVPPVWAKGGYRTIHAEKLSDRPIWPCHREFCSSHSGFSLAGLEPLAADGAESRVGLEPTGSSDAHGLPVRARRTAAACCIEARNCTRGTRRTLFVGDPASRLRIPSGGRDLARSSQRRYVSTCETRGPARNDLDPPWPTGKMRARSVITPRARPPCDCERLLSRQ